MMAVALLFVLGDPTDKNHFDYCKELGVAWRDGRIRDDVATEQKKLKEADIVIFQFPMYWFSMPAILKGWLDRIMLEGFAFTETEIYDNGYMKVGLQVCVTYVF